MNPEMQAQFAISRLQNVANGPGDPSTKQLADALTHLAWAIKGIAESQSLIGNQITQLRNEVRAKR
ncbi:hypothetical protein BMR99_03360 [Propionibacterium freudenreichii]|uniref:Uncharacterized protein n=1 Tax=Propionibacterium freudenreichii TaxID=1744 RepID=A0A509MI68_9ACTN|nr:hypothetical protein [Propionibacterium freudenreichii]ARO11688.1 hypothetical protein BMR99_03360 [Propionibacterium freudenreichii]SCQ79691.1 Hypothetical protein PFR_JS23_1458 [Propionibacterium freudenreichii]